MGVIDPFIGELMKDEPSLAWFGFEIVEAVNGHATVLLTVAPEHVNGNGMTHGGVTFALADQAFAMAANTILPYAATGDAQIHFLAPSRLGQRLKAVARVEWRDEYRTVVDVMVTADGTAVASYRGMARTIRRR